MKFNFEANLDYQRQAIDAVCDLFRGQETCRTEFTVTRDAGLQAQMEFAGSALDWSVADRLKNEGHTSS